MWKRRLTFMALIIWLVVIQLAVCLQPAPAEAAKAVKFVPTAVFNDRDGLLTVTGRFENIGNEFIAYIDDFVPVIYLDDVLYATDTFAFKIDTPPGYYREVYMKFNVAGVEFSKWYIKWDKFKAY